MGIGICRRKEGKARNGRPKRGTGFSYIFRRFDYAILFLKKKRGRIRLWLVGRWYSLVTCAEIFLLPTYVRFCVRRFLRILLYVDSMRFLRRVRFSRKGCLYTCLYIFYVRRLDSSKANLGNSIFFFLRSRVY